MIFQTPTYCIQNLMIQKVFMNYNSFIYIIYLCMLVVSIIFVRVRRS